MSDFNRLRFANLQLSARTANDLLDRFGTPDALFEAGPDEIASATYLTGEASAKLFGDDYRPRDSQLRAIETMGMRLVLRGEPDFPMVLSEIPDCPAALFIRGSLEARDDPAVAMVGTRNDSAYGRSVAERFARDLAAHGVTIVSGGAIGIDSAAHRAALAAGGRTIAVLGCGLDIDYPRSNASLFERIVQENRGALISEYPPGSAPDPWHFPLRNRIISGLSQAVVVVQAGRKSGSLITAELAAGQGREVMAVPGNIDEERSEGTNALIRDGANLVDSASDILRALGLLVLEPVAAPRSSIAEPPRDLPEAQRLILSQLTLTPKHIDALAADVRLPGVEVSVQLTLMELTGIARRLPGNCYIRAY